MTAVSEVLVHQRRAGNGVGIDVSEDRSNNRARGYRDGTATTQRLWYRRRDECSKLPELARGA